MKLWYKKFDGFLRIGLTRNPPKAICYSIDLGSIVGLRIRKSGLQITIINEEKKIAKLTELIYWEKHIWRRT